MDKGLSLLLVLIFIGCSTVGTNVVDKSMEKYERQQAELKEKEDEALKQNIYLDGNIADDKQSSANDSIMLERWKNY